MKESPANVEVSESYEALMRGAAQAFVEASVRAVQTCGRFAVALSGGSTPKSLYRLLASDPHAARVTLVACARVLDVPLAQIVGPRQGRPRWLVDAAAAVDLKRSGG